jgi:Fe-S-cluster containining protein
MNKRLARRKTRTLLARIAEHDPVPCNGCTACCRNHQAVTWQEGDDPTLFTATGKVGQEWMAMLPQKGNGDCAYLGEAGCTVYDRRPIVCRYECLWLQSQKRARPLPPELRPDRCKVVFTPTTNDSIMGAVTAPGYADAWRKGPVKDLIDQLLLAGVRTAVGAPAARFQTLIYRGGEHRVEMSPPDENGMQWRVDE